MKSYSNLSTEDKENLKCSSYEATVNNYKLNLLSKSVEQKLISKEDYKQEVNKLLDKEEKL